VIYIAPLYAQGLSW